MQPELGRVRPNVLLIPSQRLSDSSVTNRLIGDYQLTKILSLRNGSKNQVPGIWRNLKFGEIPFKEIDRTRATMNLRNNYFASPTKLDVPTFGDFDNHESVIKGNVVPSYPGDIVKPKEASK